MLGILYMINSLIVVEMRPYAIMDRTKDPKIVMSEKWNYLSISFGSINYLDYSTIIKSWVGVGYMGNGWDSFSVLEIHPNAPIYLGLGLEMSYYKGFLVGIRLPLGITIGGNVFLEGALGAKTYLSISSPGYLLYSSLSLQF